MERYIGLDVHAASCAAAVIDARGKRVGEPHVIETNGKALVEFFASQPGRVHLCLEEGTRRLAPSVVIRGVLLADLSLGETA